MTAKTKTIQKKERKEKKQQQQQQKGRSLSNQQLQQQQRVRSLSNQQLQQQQRVRSLSNQQLLLSAPAVEANAGPDLTEECRDCTQTVDLVPNVQTAKVLSQI